MLEPLSTNAICSRRHACVRVDVYVYIQRPGARALPRRRAEVPGVALRDDTVFARGNHPGARSRLELPARV
jgi:hypothetical protein